MSVNMQRKKAINIPSVVTIDDLSNQDIIWLFKIADGFRERMEVGGRPSIIRGRCALAEKYVLATLFYEPSTRTRLSFEAAMLRLGGHVISTPDANSSSATKGESIADTIRVVEGYADAIVLRHPWEGASRVAADFANVPIINAGDGSHEHPTQTLCDLYTLWVACREKYKEKEEDRVDEEKFSENVDELHFLRGMRVMLCGDLRHGRTVHSLVYGLARFGAGILPRPAPGCDFPDDVKLRLRRDYQCVPISREEFPQEREAFPDDVDAMYVTPKGPHQLSLLTTEEVRVWFRESGELKQLQRKRVDVFYSTRFQAERHANKPQTEGKKYPTVNKELLKDNRYRSTRVMHPLPRVEELGYDIDEDERGIYFQQAAFGIPVRMALITALLKIKDGDDFEWNDTHRPNYAFYSHASGIKCSNSNCVSAQESERRYLTPQFWIVQVKPLMIRCAFCDHEEHPKVVGRESTQKFVCYTDGWDKVRPEHHLVLFRDETEAREAGYLPKKKGQCSSED